MTFDVRGMRMKYVSLLAAVLLLASAALAGEKIQDKEIGVELTAPDGFKKPEQNLPFPDVVGDVRSLLVSEKFENDSGFLMIHRMPIPGGQSYEEFRTGLGDGIQERFGAAYKLHSLKDEEFSGRKAFVYDITLPGDGKLPTPEGTNKHRLIWAVFKDDDKHALGLVFQAREDQWSTMEPRFTATLKSLKIEKK